MQEGASQAALARCAALPPPQPFVSAEGPPCLAASCLSSAKRANVTVNPTLDGFYTHRLVFPPSSLSPCMAPSQKMESRIACDLDL